MNDKEMINEIKQDFKKHEEKHKQIEEIVKEIAECNKESCQDCKLTCTYHYAIKRFCELFLPEASIVLSIEEYQKDFSSQFNKGYKYGSKETAEKILSELYYIARLYYGDSANVLAWAKDKAKQLGVEIKE